MSAASLMLDIPEVRNNVSPVAVAQYHQSPSSTRTVVAPEFLVRGIVIEKTPKTPLHASIAKLLYDSLHAVVPAGYSIRQGPTVQPA